MLFAESASTVLHAQHKTGYKTNQSVRESFKGRKFS